MGATETAERLRDEADDLRGEVEDRLEDARELVDRATAELEKLREKATPAVDRVRAAAPEYAERGREAFEHAKDVAPDYAERLADSSKDAADWVVDHLGDLDIDEETVRTWGPPVLAGLVGFIVGLLVGRRMSRSEEPATSDSQQGLAHAPREREQREQGVKPPTRMPEVAEIVDVGANGEQHAG